MARDVTPRSPLRPLLWPDMIYALPEVLAQTSVPIYIVGGAVRDALLHRPLKDLDLTTSSGAVRLARQIANALEGDFFVLDAERDVGRALINTSEGRLTLDVARFRGDDLLSDLTDRDFTINAMAVDLRGDLSLLIDPLDGEKDAAAKLVRRCNPTAIASDPVRCLRAVRLAAQLDMRIEPVTIRDIRANALRMADTSPERIRDEFIRLLALANPASALRAADTLGLLQVIVPEVEPLHGLRQSEPHVFDGWSHTLAVIENLTAILSTLTYNRSDNLVASFSRGMMAIQIDRYRARLQEHLELEWPNQRPHRALLMLAALLHDAGKPSTGVEDETGRIHFLEHESVGAQLAEERAEALRLSKAEKQRLVQIVQNHMRPLLLNDPTPRAVHRFWRQLGAAGIDVCLLSLADYLGARGPELDQDGWLALVDRVRLLLGAYYDRHDQLVAPPTLVDGRKLMERFGLQPGPLIGQLLDVIREGQVAGEIQSADDALLAAQRYLANQKPG